MNRTIFDAVLLVMAVAFDLCVGEPPVFIHPVVWYGKLMSVFEKINTQNFPSFFSGTFSTLAVLSFSCVLAQIPSILMKLMKFNVYVKIISFLLSVYLLKCTFSIRSMVEHVNAAIKSDFEAYRVQMLVSRDVRKLGYEMRCSAVVESIAENFVDSVMAPLFYYALSGLSGAMVYRAANTCDAMVGYRNRKYFWFGKFAARLDDVLNFVPARLSVIFISILAMRYGRGRKTIKAVFEGIEGKVNACSMVAMAYALNLRLEKTGYYVINPEGKLPDRNDVVLAVRVFRELAVMAVFFSIILLFTAGILRTSFF